MSKQFQHKVPESPDEVNPQNACPKCGEKRMDYLAWQPPTFDEKIKCTTCGNIYSLS